MTLDCLIVGAGPAGLTAALYLCRYQRRIRVLDAGRSRTRWIERSHNVPGFPGGIAGPELLQKLQRQLADAEGTVDEGEVDALEAAGDGFVAGCGGERFTTRCVLLATGVIDAVPQVPGTDELRRAGLLRQCPICDGHEWRGRRLLVVGEGAHAEAEARFIGHFSDDVRLLAPRALQRFELDGATVRAVCEGAVHEADGVYAALGVRPRNRLALALGARCDEQGAIVTDSRLRTSVPGLWAAGDVVSALDQIAVAAGHGAIAATAIHNTLGT